MPDYSIEIKGIINKIWINGMKNPFIKMQQKTLKIPIFVLILIGSPLIGQNQNSTQPSLKSTRSLTAGAEQINLNLRAKKQSLFLSLPERKQFRKILLVAASAYLVHRWDSEIDEDYALESEEFVFQSLRWYGKVGKFYDVPMTYPSLILAGAAYYGYGRINNDPYPTETILLTLKALTWSSITTFALKAAIGRHRPYTNNGPYKTEVLDFYLDSKYHSFPSGHTSSIFAISTVLAGRMKSRTARWITYGLATSVGFQRMMDRKHWASDVIAGALIGHLVGNMVIKKNKKSNEDISVSPFTDGNTIGFALNF